ncbi:serine/threonine protein kinase, partial [Actinotalea ferrariae]|uniref:serine/threonine-protein kinase n=1 Tax=Actinotalea ferrariae TaxID=1386098 RepID=UPI001C8C0047
MERIGVAPGTEIGGYRVLGPLGHGGMGAVYRAVDGDGTTVALKLLHPHLGADPDARERLRREVSNLQRVRHPGVARVLDAEIEADEAFVVTELVEGDDLAARVRSRGPLTPVELADLAERLRGAVAVVHEAGVLHRDLTPGNVMVTDRGPVLIDFGIAQAVDDLRVTSTGLVMGTPGYLAPELLEGAAPSEDGDWWSWAALLALAATGRPPFGGPPLQAVLARARAGEPDLDGLD